MSGECNTCPVLREQNAQLANENRRLVRIIEELRMRLTTVLAQLGGVLKFIDAELQEPTMPRQKLLPAVVGRLTIIIENAGS